MTTNSQIDEMFISELGNEIVVCPLLDISPSSHPSGLLNILAYRDLTFAMEIIPYLGDPHQIVGRLRGEITSLQLVIIILARTSRQAVR